MTNDELSKASVVKKEEIKVYLKREKELLGELYQNRKLLKYRKLRRNSELKLKELELIKLTEKFKNMSDLEVNIIHTRDCLLYTSPSPRDRQRSRMPSSA